MIRARDIAALILDRFIEVFVATMIAIGLFAGIGVAARNHAGDGLPVATLRDLSPALLPIPELKPWPHPPV